MDLYKRFLNQINAAEEAMDDARRAHMASAAKLSYEQATAHAAIALAIAAALGEEPEASPGIAADYADSAE